MEQTGWDESQKAIFLRMQFEAQHTFYQKQYPQAEFDVVLVAGQAAGRLYLDRRPDEFRVIDIALLPEFRGRGIGGALMNDVMTEARVAGVPVRIHVERFNPARRLYDRLKFREIADKGVYILMEWSPAS
jgi:GNAT superfamily N-acetyltransferase